MSGSIQFPLQDNDHPTSACACRHTNVGTCLQHNPSSSDVSRTVASHQSPAQQADTVSEVKSQAQRSFDCLTMIGMPGSGKSTIGEAVAQSLNFTFVDVDHVIEQRTGRRLCELIEQYGREGFLDLEGDVCASLDDTKALFSPGGSVIYREHAMEHLKTKGLFVYLKVSYDELKMRLGDLHQRGVALPEGYTLLDLYNERCPLYERWADITVTSTQQTVEETVRDVIKQYHEYCSYNDGDM